jgi:hypothetical protein
VGATVPAVTPSDSSAEVNVLLNLTVVRPVSTVFVFCANKTVPTRQNTATIPSFWETDFNLIEILLRLELI